MTELTRTRIAGASGAAFAVALLAASGAGGYTADLIGAAALTLFLPFLAYLRTLIDDRWLANTALAAGVAGVTIKLVSIVPELGYRHIGPGPLHSALQAVADSAFDVALFPLALMLAAVAAARVLPRWLTIGAAATAVLLAADLAPGFLLFIAWTLAASARTALRPAGLVPSLAA